MALKVCNIDLIHFIFCAYYLKFYLLVLEYLKWEIKTILADIWKYILMTNTYLSSIVCILNFVHIHDLYCVLSSTYLWLYVICITYL